MDQFTGFGQVSALQMIHNLFTSYKAVDGTKPEENAVKIMGPYDPTETLARLIEQLGNGREFVRAGGQNTANKMMVSKGITLLAQTSNFNEYIQE